jgi:hypothetical protein
LSAPGADGDAAALGAGGVGRPGGDDGGPAAGAATTGGAAKVNDPRVDRLAQVVFGLLIVACFAAFILTQRLKHTPTAVQEFRMTPFFSPTPIGHIKAERISFKLARADEVTVTILDSGEHAVATLVRDWRVARYKQLSLRWNGRTGVARSATVALGPLGATVVTPVNAGQPAPAGEYHVRVRLREQSRTVTSPNGFTLVRP